ncbi:MAG TPA: MBL fold metallo-hydrolase [Candidatus Paceibacterota bacterium]
MQNKSTLSFYGGADSVTGANFLLSSGDARILIDCGLFQGGASLEGQNYEPFPYDPSFIPTLLITHAHIDHIGRIPKLVHDGFRGEIISTEATRALSVHLLHDALELLERDAAGRGIVPLYTAEDLARAESLWRGVPYETPLALQAGITARFLDAGHILGSAMIEFSRAGKKFVATGDLGNDASDLVEHTTKIEDANFLVIESVYGDKEHGDVSGRRKELEGIIEDTLARGGTLLIPAFSTERTQDLIYEIRTLMREKRVPSVPVFVDSPLASRITEVFLSCPSYFKKEIRDRLEKGENIFAFDELTFTSSLEESKNIVNREGPKIIIAGSGMSNGGRVLAHEKTYLKDPRSTLLIVGYQSAGSLGRRLLEGEKTVEIFGEKVKVRAKVVALYAYSAHRDSSGLLDFISHTANTLEKVFVVMGEPKAAAFLTQRVRDYLGKAAFSPKKGESVEIDF